MGSYIAQSDIENIFGTDNVAKWSQLDNDLATADTSRIALAITYAGETVEDKFRNSRYAIPFTGTISQKIKEWCAKIAGIWLYSNRGMRDTNAEGDKFQDMKDDVEKEMDLYVAGVRRLDAEKHDGSAPTSPFVVG